MLSILVMTILVVEVALACWVDKHLYGTLITPFSVLAGPYLLVVLLAWLLAGSLGLAPLYTPSVIVWIAGLAIVWIVNTAVAWGGMGVSGSIVADEISSRTPFEESLRLPAIVLAWILIPITLEGAWSAFRSVGGWAQIGSPEFKDAYMYGFPAHARLLTVPIIIFLIGSYKKSDKASTATIGILIFILFIGQVKGALLEPLLGGMVYRLGARRLRLTAMKVVGSLAAGYLCFNLVYLLAVWSIHPESIRDPAPYAFLFRHFFQYLFAGVLGFSEALRTGASFRDNAEVLFSPFINVLHLAYSSGAPIAAGTPKQLGMTIDLLNPDPILASNVFTLFGTVYLYIGPLFAVLYVAVMATIVSLFFSLMNKSMNPLWLVAFSYLSAQLVFGFFEIYFWHSAILEVLVYCGILGLWAAWRNREKSFLQTEPATI